MKKVNLLSREELKKVQGGIPPYTYYLMYCVNADHVLLGPPFEVPDCNTSNWENYCHTNGYYTAFAADGYSYCHGGW